MTKKSKKRSHAVTTIRRFPRNANSSNTNIYAQLVRFYPGSPLREAYRIFWDPYQIRSLSKMLEDVEPGYYPICFEKSELKAMRARSPNRTTKRVPMKVEILLTYPLHKLVRKVVTIDKRFPGEIFGLAYDLYKTIYDEDEKQGGFPAHKNKPGTPLPMNRQSGPLVWGHDMNDLSFEGINFVATKVKNLGVAGTFAFSMGS